MAKSMAEYFLLFKGQLGKIIIMDLHTYLKSNIGW